MGTVKRAMSRKHTTDVFSRFDEPYQHNLLPGIPDEVTLDLITPKLPWNMLHILSLVSLAWRRAIQNHQVYNARLRSQATEPLSTLVVLNGIHKGRQNAVCLYSVRDKSFYPLPGIPTIRRGGVPICSQCISMDGKIYVFGGAEDGSMKPLGSLYVIDLAGQRQWERCKSMLCARHSFGVGCAGKKIYVFGGYGHRGYPLRGGEVYDPESNTWNPIRPMMAWTSWWQANHWVTTIGEELFLVDKYASRHQLRAKFFLAYHPQKETFRKVTHVERNFRAELESLFLAQGELHSMTSTGVYVYDAKENSWTRRQSFSSPVITHALSCVSVRWATVAADNELLTFVDWFSGSHGGEDLLQSVGFGGRREAIAWQKIESPLLTLFSSSISLVQL